MLFADFKRLGIQQDLEDAAIAGAAFLRGICDGSIAAPVSIRAKYSSLALSRVGLGPIQKSIAPLGSQLTRAEIEAIKVRAAEAQREGRLLERHTGDRVLQLLDATPEDFVRQPALHILEGGRMASPGEDSA